MPTLCWMPKTVTSLSARRAWIEIIDYIIDYATDAVALRKESVDRNLTWHCISEDVSYVALRKESVDRNIPCGQLPTPEPRRSPQGERG